MSLDILIATRDNPVALSSLLASIIAGCSPSEIRSQRVHISDASKVPIISDRQVCRYLPLLDVHYQHTVTPGVNEQRHSLLRGLRPDAAVLSVDDDLVLLAGHLRICRAMAHLASAGQTLFGTTVDATNERGYPDYRVFASAEEADNHTFVGDEDFAEVECPALQEFSASVGHMLTSAGDFLSTLTLVMNRGHHPAIEDDACATILARSGRPLFHTGMRAWHVGNSNNWFSQGQWNDKRSRVRALVEEVTKIGDGYKESRDG